LFAIENAADALEKLAQVYEERKRDTEDEFNAQLQEMEANFAAKHKELETSFEEKKVSLSSEMGVARAAWKEEQILRKKEEAEFSSEQKKTRQREEQDYQYQRNRDRKLEEDGYQEKRKAEESGFRQETQEAERNLEERESILVSREAEWMDLQNAIAAHPKELQKAIDQAIKETESRVKTAWEQKLAMEKLERDWERKMLNQRIEHLEQNIVQQEEKLANSRTELTQALQQVHQIADKAIDGASYGKAFQSVNQIAMQQARRSDGEKIAGKESKIGS